MPTNKSSDPPSSDSSIGRPSPWGEGRYEEKNATPKESVLKEPGEGDEAPDTVSTPVTQRDYTGR
jgi:hypothetical protein